MYVYNAELWCDECGESLSGRLTAEGVEDTGDSDKFPQSGLEGESDGPNHCAAGNGCIAALDLTQYGLSVDDDLHGAETARIGAWLDESLTDYGVEYLQELLDESNGATPYQLALHRFWREAYASCLS